MPKAQGIRLTTPNFGQTGQILRQKVKEKMEKVLQSQKVLRRMLLNQMKVKEALAPPVCCLQAQRERIKGVSSA